MKFEVEKKELETALGIAMRAVNPRSPMLVLQNVLFTAVDDKLTLISNNLDSAYEITIPCATDEPGQIALPAKTLMDIVSKFANAPVSVAYASRDGRVTMKCGRGKFDLPFLPAEEYPKPAQFEQCHRVPAHLFAAMINAAVFAAAHSDESRAVMTGIHIAGNGGHLEILATDGRRAILTSSTADGIPDFKAIVAGESARQLVKLLLKEHPDDYVSFSFSNNFGAFTCGNVVFSFRLLEGVFPDVHRLRTGQTQFSRHVKCDREALASSLSRVIVTASDKQSPNFICFDFGDNSVLISSNTPDVGSGQEELPCVVDGSPLLVAFNGAYLLEFLRTLSSEEVEIQMQNDTMSALITPLPAVENMVIEHIIMPIRMREVVEAST